MTTPAIFLPAGGVCCFQPPLGVYTQQNNENTHIEPTFSNFGPPPPLEGTAPLSYAEEHTAHTIGTFSQSAFSITLQMGL